VLRNVLVLVRLSGDKTILCTDGTPAHRYGTYDYTSYAYHCSFFKNNITMPGVNHTLFFDQRMLFKDQSVALVASKSRDDIEPGR
jgi:hypothetical protein